jgi:rubrerythrin
MQNIEFAIKMEVDAAEYYRKQAEIYKDFPIARSFDLLVKAELKHQELLHNYKMQAVSESEMADLSEQDNIFSDLADFKNDIRLIPRQLDVYQKALEMEQQSIQLYSKLNKNAKDQSEHNLFQFLINEEQKHYELFEELVKLVKRPDDWVEDAEFGNREEY